MDKPYGKRSTGKIKDDASRLALRRWPIHLFAILLPFSVVAPLASAQTSETTVPAEYGKLIRAPRALGTLGIDLFGDKVNLYTGSLEFVQTDISLPGNSSLPVTVARRMSVGNPGSQDDRYFKNWDLDIPRIYGTFASSGWRGVNAAGEATTQRCTNFGAPLPMYRPNTGTSYKFRATEYWHGNMLNVPGHGEQEILKTNPKSGVKWPTDGQSSPLVTRNFWVVRCLDRLSSTNAATSADDAGEGFLALAPDGTQYKFDWLVSRFAESITKTFGPNTKFTLNRVEVSIYPTVVTDRFGNTVHYKYDPVDKWKLLEIRSADGAGNSDRVLTFDYLPGTRHIVSVTDGIHTWRYDYGTDGRGTGILSTVTLPDQSKWQLGGLGAESIDQPGLAYLHMMMSEPDADTPVDYECDPFPPLVRNGESRGTMIHPSGAIGTFKVFPVRHGRNGIPKECYSDDARAAGHAYYPRYSDVFALSEKVVEGPGLEPMRWTTSYDTFYPGWDDCMGCNPPSTVTVTDPKGIRTRHSFGNTFRVDEGMPKQIDIDWNGSTALRTAITRYNHSFIEPVGFSDQDRGSSKLNSRIVPEDMRDIVQQDVTFKWEAASAGDFDDKGRALRSTMSSTGGMPRTEIVSYQDELTKWILHRVSSITDSSTGLVKVSTVYDPVSGKPKAVTQFGKLIESYTYYADGNLASRADERNPATEFSNYKRGVPRNVKHSDAYTESAVVDDYGSVTSYTDQNQFTWVYGYDAMGRLERVAYPQENGYSWTETSVNFKQIQTDEFGLSPGHWRQELKTGLGMTATYYDALWRPVVVKKSDEADPLNTTSITQQKFDFNGRATFSSYAQRNYTAFPSGVTTEYDPLGRITRTRADSELGQLVATNEYISGFKTRATNGRSKATIYSFQTFDQPVDTIVTEILAPESVTVRIERDVFGKPKSINRSGLGKSVIRSYVYDASQRLCKTVEPENGATISAYDAASNVAWRASGLALTSNQCDTVSVPANKKTVFGYDARNRLKATEYGDNSPAIGRTYTPDGLVKTVSSNGAVWTYEYNRRRLNTSETLSYVNKIYTIIRDYDLNGFMSKATYPLSALTLNYQPNALGQASRVGGFATGIMYHPSGAVAEFTYGNGIRRVMKQNARGLPEWSTDTGVLNEKYTYDENGNAKEISDALSGTASRTMSYDDLDRLLTVSAPGLWGNASYTYDAIDNLTGSTIGIGPNARQLIHEINRATNLLDRVYGAPSNFSFGYEYDTQGNITKRGTQTFSFDQGNRMTAAVGRATYAYDGWGRRVSTVGTDQVNTIQIYTQDGKILYSGPSGGGGTKYIYLGNHQIAEVK